MNKLMLAKMLLNKDILYNFYTLHKKFAPAPNYKLLNMLKCGLNVIKNDRLVEHQGDFLINSFIPPLNSAAFLNIALQVPGGKNEFFTNHVAGKRLAPISTYIAATKKCMYQCWHCSASRFTNSDAMQDFTKQELMLLVQKLQDLGVGIIGFTGGEPLLRDDLAEVIAAIKKTSISLVFSTGFGLTYAKARELKQAGLFGIAISLDSISAAQHDNMRGYKGAFTIALQAITNAKKAGLYTMTQTVCTKELLSSKEIFALAKLVKKLQVDEMRIMEPLPCGNLNEQQEQLLSSKEQKALKNLHVIFNNDQQYPKTSVFPYFESAEQFGCGAGSQHSYVDAQGNFLPCDFMTTSYGNLLQETAETIWHKMHEVMGRPKLQCYAKYPAASNSKLPRFYRLLGGLDE